MSFAWPAALAVVLAAPALVALHLWQLRRRRRNAVRVASLSIVRGAVGPSATWRRHVPVGLLAGALLVLGVAAARPSASVQVPQSRTTILLALDTSGSMCNVDVAPNRLTVAQEAAARFVRGQDDGTRIGLVAFNGFASLVVPPTTDDDALTDAIAALTVARGTAIGLATIEALDAIAEVNPAVEPTSVDLGDPAAPVAPDGEYQPDIVVLLTDGANSRGVDPVLAAGLAVQRRVRVYTIGFGTTEPQSSSCTPEQIGAGGSFGGGFGAPGFGGGGAGGRRGIFEIDEVSLQTIADMTGGEYYRAQDADQLVEVFERLPSRVSLVRQETELSVAFALVGTLLAVAAVALAQRWNRTV